GVGIFVAANDYKVEIPLEDFVRYDVIFATSMNGDRLSLRDKGPIWIIYPMSDHRELRDPAYNQRLIWQLVRIELE
ncbi:MAG TPA: oxidoreductase, partial [Sphingomonadaceae bacterium]|nr:oxidoreductase [Sphingomonadaceae bacterium]